MHELQQLGKEVHASLDPMSDALVDFMADMSPLAMNRLSAAFLAWAVPTHIFAHRLNQLMETGEYYFNSLPALAYGLAPFNQSMLELLDDPGLINSMALQWMALRESCDSLLSEIGIPN